jgi:putative ABC transport system permease protein
MEANMSAGIDAIKRALMRPFYALGLLSGFWIATLALGIAVASVSYTLIQQAVLRPLDFPKPNELFAIQRHEGFCVTCPVSAPLLHDIEKATGLITAGVTISENRLSATHLSAQSISAASVTERFFELYGVPAVLGRNLAASDAGSDAIMLSDAMWQSEFNRDPAIIGKSVRVGNSAKVIVGIAHPEFARIHRAHIFEVQGFSDSADGSNFLDAIVRRPAEVTESQLQLSLERALATARARSPDNYASSNYRLVPKDLRLDRTRNIQALMTPVLWVLGLIAFLLCANTASLFAVSTLQRVVAINTELALGAKRERILLGIAAQALLFTLIASVLAALLIPWLFEASRSYLMVGMTRLLEVQVSWLNWLLVACVFALCNVMAGVIPGYFIVRGAALNRAERSQVNGSGVRLGRMGLAAQLVGASAVLMLALLLVRTSSKIAAVDPGFDLAPVWTAKLILPNEASDRKDPNNDQLPNPDLLKNVAFISAVRERIGQLPGVESVSIAGDIPLGDQAWNNGTVIIPGAQSSDPNNPPYVQFRPVSEGYAESLGLKIVSGRMPTWRAGDEILELALNQAYVDRYMQGIDPVGRVVEDLGARVVGVLQDVRQVDLTRAVEPDAYAPFAAFFWFREVQVILRLDRNADRGAIYNSVRKIIQQIDPNVPVFEPMTGAQLKASSAQSVTLLERVMLLFAALAMLTSMLGLFGLSAFQVARQKREFGLRLAIGAAPMKLLAEVMGRELKLSSICVLLGVLLSLMLSTVIAARLYGVERTDVSAISVTVLAMLFASLLATLVPAWRASRTNPLTSLRAD